MSERLQRREIKHDRFIEEVEDVYGSIRRNTSKIIGTVIAIGVALAIVGGIYLYNQKREDEAQVKLAEAIRTLDKPIAGQPGVTAEQASPYKTEQERDAKALSMFQEVVERYRGRDAADIASLYVAQMDVAKGNVKDAEPKLQAFLQSHSDHMLAGAAQMSLYQLQIAQGNSQKVIDQINTELAADHPKAPKDALLGLLAQIYETQGQDAKAKDAYQRLINEYPDSPFTIDAQRKIAHG